MLNFKVTLKEKNKLFDSSFFSFSFRLLMYDFLFSARQLSSPPPCLFFFTSGTLCSMVFSPLRILVRCEVDASQTLVHYFFFAQHAHYPMPKLFL